MWIISPPWTTGPRECFPTTSKNLWTLTWHQTDKHPILECGIKAHMKENTFCYLTRKVIPIDMPKTKSLLNVNGENACESKWMLTSLYWGICRSFGTNLHAVICFSSDPSISLRDCSGNSHHTCRRAHIHSSKLVSLIKSNVNTWLNVLQKNIPH